uniref:Integrase core domain containing protein n=1 Tax=Solanum tuberosum TaxID=4113 RepID=M1DBL8_SOLTU
MRFIPRTMNCVRRSLVTGWDCFPCSESTSVVGCASGSAIGSSSHGKAFSSNEAISLREVPGPPNTNPAPVAEESNRWCVEGQWQIYRDAKMLNEKKKMARLITEERRVLMRSLHTIPDIHQLFQLHKCDWMARIFGTYIEEIVQEFYASYAATLHDSIDKRSKPTAQDPFTSTLVRGIPVDISQITISRFLYGTGTNWAVNTTKLTIGGIL